MDSFITHIAGILMATWFGAYPGATLTSQVDYQCQSPQWTSGPKVVRGKFQGTVEVDCTFKGSAGGSLQSLTQYMVDETKQGAKAILSGPTQETYSGMPSTYFNLTTVLKSGGLEATATGEYHLATDGTTKVLSVFNSSQITGEGEAKHLKELDSTAAIGLGTGAGNYTVKSSTTFVITKPGFVPARVFLNQVKQRIEKGVPEQEQELIEDIASHI